MKKYGFSIIELMIALAMATAIIFIMISSFASLNGDFMYSWNQMNLQRELRVSLNIMLKELRNSGTFGNFSFHNQTVVVYESAGTAANCSGNWCNFDASNVSGMGVGVRSYNHDAMPSNVIPSAVALDVNSDVLRVQYGGSNSAALNFGALCSGVSYPFKYANGFFNCLNFMANTLTPSRIYMLSSSNKAYLLNFSSTVSVANLVANAPNIGVIESSVESGIIYTPDVYTMTLSNFHTSYYFIGTQNGIKGLYMLALKNDGSALSNPKLISANITMMKVEYQLAFASNASNEVFNNSNQANNVTNLRYYWCSTSSMNNANASYAGCGNGNWNRVVDVNITLRGQSTDKVDDGNYLTEVESASVGWLW